MRAISGALCAATLAFALAACADADEPSTAEAGAGAGLAGTWVAELDSAQINDTSSYLIADGAYTCQSCTPPYSVPASGEWERVDRPGADGVKVRIMDDRTVSFAVRLGEKELTKGTWSVSADGKSMTVRSTYMGGEKATSSTTILTRVSAGPAGSHAASGDWKFSEFAAMDDAARTFSYAITGDTITQTTNSGGYTATLGGEPVAIEGSNAGAMVAVVKLSDTSYRETVTLDGEVVNVIELNVAGDTLTAAVSDPRDSSTAKWRARRKTD